MGVGETEGRKAGQGRKERGEGAEAHDVLPLVSMGGEAI